MKRIKHCFLLLFLISFAQLVFGQGITKPTKVVEVTTTSSPKILKKAESVVSQCKPLAMEKHQVPFLLEEQLSEANTTSKYAAPTPEEAKFLSPAKKVDVSSSKTSSNDFYVPITVELETIRLEN